MALIVSSYEFWVIVAICITVGGLFFSGLISQEQMAWGVAIGMVLTTLWVIRLIVFPSQPIVENLERNCGGIRTLQPVPTSSELNAICLRHLGDEKYTLNAEINGQEVSFVFDPDNRQRAELTLDDANRLRLVPPKPHSPSVDRKRDGEVILRLRIAPVNLSIRGMIVENVETSIRMTASSQSTIGMDFLSRLQNAYISDGDMIIEHRSESKATPNN